MSEIQTNLSESGLPPLAVWLRRQPTFKAGEALPERLLYPTADDFNRLKDDLNKPNLGLATTRELLVELLARGEADIVTYRGQDRGADGAVLSGAASAVSKTLSAEALDYRTVDSQ